MLHDNPPPEPHIIRGIELYNIFMGHVAKVLQRMVLQSITEYRTVKAHWKYIVNIRTICMCLV